MAPVILVTLVLLWQCVLLGYTYTLAGNAADEAVRAAATAEGGQGACEQAGREDLPGAWQDGATISCGGRGPGYVTARVELKVPVLLPGLIGFPVPVKAHAGAVEEGKAN
ncbi:pilus assembly protein [Streptomyces thermoviolaceus]|uniref:pilus assembly protein n=1 Tax=Streptomyces thermoviolaceus TaxID=1952 RepID=UPI001E35C7A9|nr:pilus assembly protein [Streptomyces thermoviolaceus]